MFLAASTASKQKGASQLETPLLFYKGPQCPHPCLSNKGSMFP